MSLLAFSGLLLVYVLSLMIIVTLNVREMKQERFNFHLFFTLLFLLTFYFGFPLTSILVFRFDTQVVPADFLLQAMLSATAFYVIYFVSYKVRLRPMATSPARPWLQMNRVETHLTCGLLALVAIATVTVFSSITAFYYFASQPTTRSFPVRFRVSL